jgi:hypothetical protein
MPFLWEPPPPVDASNEWTGEVSLLAASLLCPFRVARVSRLIGNSDITANSRGWQVTNWMPDPARMSAFPN